jgi:hypothetical protein
MVGRVPIKLNLVKSQDKELKKSLWKLEEMITDFLALSELINYTPVSKVFKDLELKSCNTTEASCNFFHLP